jgi:endogenous inhibitor of DNA gyrase (YacG/DUF329 family)
MIEENIWEYIPIEVFQSYKMYKNNKCPVCQNPSPFADMERVKKLPDCGHLYHEVCLQQWLEENSNCAICYNPLDVKRIKEAHIQIIERERALAKQASLAAGSNPGDPSIIKQQKDEFGVVKKKGK